MEYRVLNTQPEIMSVDVDTLKSRIDAHHYRPRFLSAAEKVLNVKYSNPSVLGKETHKIGQPADIRIYSNSGKPILNARNVRPLHLNNGDCPLVELEIADRHQKQTLKGDEVLIVRTGAKCGDVAWASNTFTNYLVNSHVIPIRTKKNLKTTFLAAYLSSSLGQQLLDREMTGAAQRQVSVASLNSTIVPLPSPTLQEYIGQKIFLAEKCRDAARFSYDKAARMFDSVINFSKFKETINWKGKANFVSPELLEYKLFAGAYLPKYIQLDKHIRDLDVKFEKLSSLCEPIEYGHMPTEDYASVKDGVPFIRVTNITGNLTIDTKDLKYIPLQSEISSKKVRENDILLVQCGNTTGKIGVVTKETDSFLYPSFSFRIRSKGGINQFYLAHILNSDFVQMLLWRTVKYSTVRPNTTKPDVEDLLIPILNESTRNQIGRLTKLYIDLRGKALALTNQAKTDVEALIEGKLDTDAILSGKLKAPTWEDIERELEGI